MFSSLVLFLCTYIVVRRWSFYVWAKKSYSTLSVGRFFFRFFWCVIKKIFNWKCLSDFVSRAWKYFFFHSSFIVSNRLNWTNFFTISNGNIHLIQKKLYLDRYTNKLLNKKHIFFRSKWTALISNLYELHYVSVDNHFKKKNETNFVNLDIFSSRICIFWIVSFRNRLKRNKKLKIFLVLADWFRISMWELFEIGFDATKCDDCGG